jgi:AcrR family transcriptional regulator
MRATHDVKREILDLAETQIRLKGFNGFSYRDIAGIMDVRTPAIHHHFHTKSDLGVAVINRELDKLAFREKWDVRLSGEEQLKKFIRSFYQDLGDGCMCLTGALTSDFRSLPEEVQDKTSKMCRAIVDQVAAALEKARSEKSVQFRGKAYDRALMLLSNMLASRLIARSMGDSICIRIVDQLLEDMGSRLKLSELLSERIQP